MHGIEFEAAAVEKLPVPAVAVGATPEFAQAIGGARHEYQTFAPLVLPGKPVGSVVSE